MAKIIEEVIAIKVSKLVKDNADQTEILSEEVLSGLEAVAQELCGTDVIVEVIKG